MFDFDIKYKVSSWEECYEEVEKINEALEKINKDNFLNKEDKTTLVQSFDNTFTFPNADDSSLINAFVTEIKDGKIVFKHGFCRGLKYEFEDEWVHNCKKNKNRI